jgi:hypothetical protein
VPWRVIAAQAQSQPTAYSAATEDTERHSWPTWRVTSDKEREIGKAERHPTKSYPCHGSHVRNVAAPGRQGSVEYGTGWCHAW